MPTYHCTSPAGLLDAGKKSSIAAEITRIHNAVTGSASFFAQVIYTDVAKGNHFMGGAARIGADLRSWVHSRRPQRSRPPAARDRNGDRDRPSLGTHEASGVGLRD